MGIIEDKYSIYYINDKRYYVETMNKSLMLENTIPYMFEYKNIRIYDTAWNRITVKILEEIDALNPKSEEELLSLKYDWSSTSVFSKDKLTNFLPFKNIYINTNHTAVHAGMNIQLLLKAYNIPLEECKIHIRRHPSAEPKEVRDYYRNITINGLKKVLMLIGLSQKSIETTIGNMDVINKKILSELSNGFTDFYLFDDYNYFVNYKVKTLEYVKNKYYGTPYVVAAEKGLRYLDIYYKHKKVFDTYSRVGYLMNNKEMIDKEINYLFNQSPIKAISVSKLISRLRIVNSDFMTTIKSFSNNDDFYALLNALFYKNYIFKKPFIAADDSITLSNDDLITSYAYSLDRFTIGDITKYSDKMHLKRRSSYLNMIIEISGDYIQVGPDAFVSKDSFSISDSDLDKIKNELSFYINSFGNINTDNYNGYTQLPKLEYQWNKHLLIGIVRTYLSSYFKGEYTSNFYDTTEYIIKFI